MSNSFKKTIKRIGNITFGVLISLLALVICTTFYSKISGKNVFKHNVLWVLTDSMEDTIPERSYILVKESDGNDVGVGDVITFYSNDPTLEINGQRSLNTHRIVQIDEDGKFITRGDHNPADDKFKVDKSDVVYKYVKNLPVLTSVGRAYASSWTIVILILLGVAVVVGKFVLSAFEKEQETKKSDEIELLVQKEVERLKTLHSDDNDEKDDKDNSHNE